MQDGYVPANRDAMAEEFHLLDEALTLAIESIEAFKSEPIRIWRREESDDSLQAEGIRLNLAHSMCLTVVNMLRLLEFGAFVNFFSLYRDALEMYAYFWYLGDKPSEVRMWNDLRGTQKSIIEYGKEDYLRIQRKVVKKFQRKAASERFHKDTYTLLATLGTHTNPHSLSMFLTTERHKRNFGFCSAGEDENLRCSSHSVLHLMVSLLKDLYFEFEERIPVCRSELRKVAIRSRSGRQTYNYVPTSLLLPKQTMCLQSRYAELQDRFDVYDSTFEGKWNFW